MLLKHTDKVYRAFSSAGLEHLPYKQRVGGSNPSTPTGVFPRGFLFGEAAGIFLFIHFFISLQSIAISFIFYRFALSKVHIKEMAAEDRKKTLYVSADHSYFTIHTLTELASQFVREGGEWLYIDTAYDGGRHSAVC